MEGKKIRKDVFKKGKRSDIIKMNFPTKRVEVCTATYRFSKMHTSSYKSFPNEDECLYQAGMAKVLALRQLDMAEKRLIAKRAEAKQITKTFDQRWLQLHEGQKSLRENFIKFEEFMKENLEKRERARRKMQEEINLQEDRKDMLQKLKNQIEYYQKIQARMVKKIKEYRLYEDFLGKLVETSINFKNVPAVLNRFQALIETKGTSSTKHETEVVAILEARAKLSKLMEEKSTVLLGLRSVCGDLNYRYEAAQVNALLWESTLQEVRQHILQEVRQSICVLRAGKQLHKMMCLRQNEVPKPLDFEERMQFIKHTLTEMHWLRHVKFAIVKNTNEQPHETRQTVKPVMKQATEEEEEQAVKEMAKSRLSIFAYLLHENRSKRRPKKCINPQTNGPRKSIRLNRGTKFSNKIKDSSEGGSLKRT